MSPLLSSLGVALASAALAGAANATSLPTQIPHVVKYPPLPSNCTPHDVRKIRPGFIYIYHVPTSCRWVLVRIIPLQQRTSALGPDERPRQPVR